MEMNKPRPIKRFSSNGITVCCWAAKRGGVNFTIEKSYKDKMTNTWKQSRQFFLKDLEILKEMIEPAVQFGKEEAEQMVAYSKEIEEEQF